MPTEEVPDGEDNDCDDVVDEAPAGTLPDWCNLQHPPAMTSSEGLQTAPAYGQVLATGFTEADGQHPGLIAELGWGPDGSDPSAGAAWTWQAARHNTQVGDNDEYVAHLTVLDAGSYDYGYRFSVDGGVSWLYCDLDSSGVSAYSAEQAGDLTVGPGVEWANLQWPHSAEGIVAGSEVVFFGQAYQPGVTPGAGQGEGLVAEAGFGPDGSDPREANAGWTWVGAPFHADQGNNDEFRAALYPPEAGTFDVAFRYSINGGLTWVYGDIDGSRNGYSPQTAGHLVVIAALPPLVIGWAGSWGMNFGEDAACGSTREDLPDPLVVTADMRDRAACRQIVAELWIEGFTDSDEGDPERIQAQVRRLPVVDEVEGEPELLSLTHYGRTGNNFEYRWDIPLAELQDPPATTWHYTFRFSGDGGETWYVIGVDDGPDGGHPRTLQYGF